MSTLTKVFVVLLVLFSIAFTVMTVSTVSQTANWRETADRYQVHALVADTNLRSLIAANSAELATARDAVNAQLSRGAELESELRDTSNEAAQLAAEVERVASEKSSADAMNRGLVAQLEASNGAQVEYRTQRDGLEKQNVDLQRRNIDLNDRVNELTARIVVLAGQKRQFEQQINLLKAENEKLALAGRERAIGTALESPGAAAMTDVSALTPVAPSAIRGQVLEVADNIVTISVGSADGVKKDMVFVLHRDGSYVGDLRIDLVDPDAAAGRIVRSNFTPRVGDSATDANWLGTSRG